MISDYSNSHQRPHRKDRRTEYNMNNEGNVKTAQATTVNQAIQRHA